MNRLDLLLTAYRHYDQIYSCLILFAIWVAVLAHLVDWLTVNRGRVLITIFWTLAIITYISGIIFIGLRFA
jgi:hypothetical protein